MTTPVQNLTQKMVYIKTIRMINELTSKENDNILVIGDIHRDDTTRHIKGVNNPTHEASELANFRTSPTIIEYKTSTANNALRDWKAHIYSDDEMKDDADWTAPTPVPTPTRYNTCLP